MPAGSTSSPRRRDAFAQRADAREPHAQARAHRSAPVQRHRQRLLRRDPAPRPALAARAHAQLDDAAIAALCTSDARRARGVDASACAREAAGAFPAKVTAFRPGWPCTAASGSRARLRRAGAADRLRGERMQLLRALPDRRHACSPTARCRACCTRASRARSTRADPALAAHAASSAREARPPRRVRPARRAGARGQPRDASAAPTQPMARLLSHRGPPRWPDAPAACYDVTFSP